MYYYTIQEGGTWNALPYLENPEEVKRELMFNFHPGHNASDCYSILAERKVFAVKFSDGLIWDAYLQKLYGKGGEIELSRYP